MPSQVKLLITNNAFYILQRATAQNKIKTGIIHVMDGSAEAPPVFQAGWSDCTYLFSFFVRFICSSGISV
jgi:hypothetical protein